MVNCECKKAWTAKMYRKLLLVHIFVILDLKNVKSEIEP
jgi:hypothetical protein